jgi:replicative DNA helicase
MHLSLEKLQLLACELRGCGTHPQAIERVCDYVVHDPVYADSTRSIFQSTLELLRRRAR